MGEQTSTITPPVGGAQVHSMTLCQSTQGRLFQEAMLSFAIIWQISNLCCLLLSLSFITGSELSTGLPWVFALVACWWAIEALCWSLVPWSTMLLIFVIDRTIHQRAREVSHPPNSVLAFPADVTTQCSNERAILLIFLTQKPSQRVCLRFSSCCHVSKVHAVTWSFAFLAVMMLLLSLIALLQPHFQPFMLSVWTGCKAILSCHLPMADCHNYLTCIILKHCNTVVPCWCWCEPVHMPVMRSAVLCGFHSGDLVPDLHGSVLESEDIEILATHVSHHDLGVCVLKSLKSSRLYGAEQMFQYSVYLNISMHSNVFLFLPIFSYAIIIIV